MFSIPTIPVNAPFTEQQRQWLNGFLAGYFSGTGEAAPNVAGSAADEPRSPVLVLYGSQTGTAEQLAKKLGKSLEARGFASSVLCMEAYAGAELAKTGTLLVVTSTYGDGEPPDNAVAFWKFLKSDSAPSLAHLRYSVLALGDTNYSGFCQFGRDCDERLEQLGAQRIHPRVDCDVDYTAAADCWRDGVLLALSGNSSAVHTLSEPAPEAKAFGKLNPFPARLRTNRLLSGLGSAKEVRHFEIALGDSGLTYEVGDALGVWPTNCPALVTTVLERLGCDGEEAVTLKGAGETSLRLALMQHLDVTKPSPALLQAAGRSDPELEHLLNPTRKDDLRAWLWGREVIDLIDSLPSSLGAIDFVGLLKPLQPRLYSISSSPIAHPGEVHLTVGIVRYVCHGRTRGGVASTFLSDRVGEHTPVPIFVQTSHGFRLPAKTDVPIIMCGPGTGIAPFRAFLEEREAAGATGRNWLFFGDQRRETDFLYREQIEAWRTSGHLTRLDLAFSRDLADKVYVQHRMLEAAEELWRWLQEGAHFYVCGDANRMARDVDVALHTVCERAGGLSPEVAVEFVARLKAENRYQRDVY